MMKIKEWFYANAPRRISTLIAVLNAKLDLYREEISAFSSKEGEDVDALEYWLVSEWLAEKLKEKGEPATTNFLGLPVWGRCTTGSAPYTDEVIEEIYDECNKRRKA